MSSCFCLSPRYNYGGLPSKKWINQKDGYTTYYDNQKCNYGFKMIINAENGSKSEEYKGDYDSRHWIQDPFKGRNELLPVRNDLSLEQIVQAIRNAYGEFIEKSLEVVIYDADGRICQSVKYEISPDKAQPKLVSCKIIFGIPAEKDGIWYEGVVNDNENEEITLRALSEDGTSTINDQKAYQIFRERVNKLSNIKSLFKGEIPSFLFSLYEHFNAKPADLSDESINIVLQNFMYLLQQMKLITIPSESPFHIKNLKLENGNLVNPKLEPPTIADTGNHQAFLDSEEIKKLESKVEFNQAYNEVVKAIEKIGEIIEKECAMNVNLSQSDILAGLTTMYYLSTKTTNIYEVTAEELIQRGLITSGSIIATKFDYFRQLMEKVSNVTKGYSRCQSSKDKNN